MRLDELDKEPVKKVVFTFGRLNPPHYGHMAMIQTLQKVAKEQGADWYLFVSGKTGDEKNPLTYEQKVWWIKALFPEVAGHLVEDPRIKTPLVAATWLYKEGYRSATFVAGEDDMESYSQMIKGGNQHGQKNPDAVKIGKGFIFDPLEFAISPRLASATNARKSVTDGDPETFTRNILGPKAGDAKLAALVQNQLYPTLRKAMGLGESVGESTELNKHTPDVRELAKKYTTDPATIHHQINRGVKVEFEHTNDVELATEIAMDHLGERLDYYDLLDKLEKTPTKKFGENFADGKGPGKPGDSQRHGITKKATMAELEKVSHAEGRKGQLARWQLNMRRGKKKANEDGPFAFAGGPGGNADGSNLLDRRVAMYPWDINTPHPKEIDEVADQPYRFISPVSTATAQKSMFQTDSGSTIQVFIQVDTGNGVADIGFFDATDKENPTIGVTGKGDAFRIFATVGSIVKQFVAKRKPPYISFSGKSSDAGRIKLYDMIAKNIGRYLPEYKLIDSGFANDYKGYTFKRVAQESVSEVAKVKLSSDPNNFGAWVNDSGKPEKTIMIPINKLSGFEPDSKFDDPTHAKNLANIVKAIKAGKELPPILVRRHGIDRFQVLDGHHRFKAYRMAGMKSIPARLVDPKNVSEEKKPKKPKTIVDGALKTLIAKGRSEDEAIADLKKEIDSKFYELDESLNERKMADLYHSTDIDNLAAILKSGQLTPGRNVYVSLTRDKNYLFAKDSSVEYAVFVIDQAKLAYNKKIEPYDFHMSDEEDPEDFARDIEARRSESEERVKGPISLRYVKAIMMPVSWSPENMKKEIEAAKQQDGDDYRSDLSMTSLVKQRCGKKLRIIKTFQKLGINVNFSIEENLEETLKKVKGEWALVSRKNPKKVLQYYHGSGHPSKDWVSKVERRVHSFESTDYNRGEELEGIDIMGAPVFITHHAIERLDRKGDRSVDVEEIYEIIEKAVRQHGRDIASLHNTDFALKGENGPPREPKNGFGIALAKTEDSTGNPVYVIKTLHPKLLIGKMPGFKVQGLKRRYSMYEEVEETIKPRVYLDMDGVLADFFGEWAKLAGVEHYKDIDNAEEKLQLVRDHPTFWIDLPLLPHARALVKTVIEKYGEYRVCSTPLNGDERSKPGKIAWLNKHFADMPPAEIVLTHNKAEHAQHDGVASILVDDFGSNINKWRAAGGIGIKYDDSAFPQVAKVLTSIAKSGVVK